MYTRKKNGAAGRKMKSKNEGKKQQCRKKRDKTKILGKFGFLQMSQENGHSMVTHKNTPASGGHLGSQNEGKLQQCRKKMDKTNILGKIWIFTNVARKWTLNGHSPSTNVARKGQSEKWKGQISLEKYFIQTAKCEWRNMAMLKKKIL